MGLFQGRRRWNLFEGLWGGMGSVGPGRGCARCTLWTTLSPSPGDVICSPFKNLTFVTRRTTSPSSSDDRSPSPTGEMILPSPHAPMGCPRATPSSPHHHHPFHHHIPSLVMRFGPPPPIHHCDPPLRTSPLSAPRPPFRPPPPPLEENRVAPPPPPPPNNPKLRCWRPWGGCPTRPL